MKGIAITDRGFTKYLGAVRLSCGGEVKEADRIVVVCDGVAREVWPPDYGAESNLVLLTADPQNSYDIQESPLDSEAYFEYSNTDAKLYWETGSGRGEERAFSRSLAPGEYLMRMTSYTGSISPQPDWQDPATDFIGWYLVNTNDSASVEEGSGVIEIAENNAGSPGAILVSKPVTFEAEVSVTVDPPDESNLVWERQPSWFLTDITTTQPARVSATALYDLGGNVGVVRGYQGGVQSEEELYANPADRSESVWVEITEGDPADLIGPPPDVPIQLDYINNLSATWAVEANTPGEDKFVRIRMYFIDGTGTQNFKRINLTATYNTDDGPDIPPEPGQDPSMIDTVNWTGGFGVAFGFDGATAKLVLSVRGDTERDGSDNIIQDGGVVNFFDQDGVNQADHPQPWLDNSPDVADAGRFQVKLTNGIYARPDEYPGSVPPNVWIPATDNPLWEFSVSPEDNTIKRDTTWVLEIREGFDNDTKVFRTYNLSVNLEGNPVGIEPGQPVDEGPPVDVP